MKSAIYLKCKKRVKEEVYGRIPYYDNGQAAQHFHMISGDLSTLSPLPQIIIL